MGVSERQEAEVVVLGPAIADSFASQIAAGFQDAGIPTALVDTRTNAPIPGAAGPLRRPGKLAEEVIRRSPTARRLVVDRHVRRSLEGTRPQLVLCTNAYLLPDEVARWRALTPGAVWALWYPDAIVNLANHVALLAPYDHYFFKEPYLVEVLSERTDLRVHFLPEACSPQQPGFEEPTSPSEAARYRCQVMIAGNLYPYRVLLLRSLPDAVDLKLYGSIPSRLDPHVRHAHTGRVVTGREKSLAYRGADIVLNTMHFAELRSVNGRLFEATACGAFVLTHRAPALAEYFAPGVEVADFATPAELRAAVTHYLHPARAHERSLIAARGQRRAHAEHTYRHRLDTLLAACGLERLRDGLRQEVAGAQHHAVR